MADKHTDHAHPDHVAHHGPTFYGYLAIFVALSVFTLLSFIINWICGIGDARGAALIMAVAVCKAFLVGMVFMHLKWDWYKLYFMIAPAFILGTMMMIVLLPDMVLAWR